MRIIKQYKRIIIPILIYIILLPVIFYLFSGSPPETEVPIYKGVFMTSAPMGFDWLHEDGVNIQRATLLRTIDTFLKGARR